jgi:hypothetical protein
MILVRLAILFFSVIIFYLAISPSIFYPRFPDELVATKIFSMKGGLFSCAHQYYVGTTINRVTADFVICGLAGFSKLFPSQYVGWFSSTLLIYSIIPTTICIFICNLFQTKWPESLTYSFLISALALNPAINQAHNLWGLDLAIYASGIIFLFLFFSFFFKIKKNKVTKLGSLIFFFLSLNSHEIYLVFGCYFLLVYLVSDVLKNRVPRNISYFLNIGGNFYFLYFCIILLISSLLTILAPQLGTRLNTWDTVSLWDGIRYIHIPMNQMFNYLRFYPYVFLCLFLLGLSIKPNNMVRKKYTMELVIIFTWPLIFLIALSFLIGLTPQLQFPGAPTLAERHAVTLLIGFALNICLIGSFFRLYLDKKYINVMKYSEYADDKTNSIGNYLTKFTYMALVLLLLISSPNLYSASVATEYIIFPKRASFSNIETAYNQKLERPENKFLSNRLVNVIRDHLWGKSKIKNRSIGSSHFDAVLRTNSWNEISVNNFYFAINPIAERLRNVFDRSYDEVPSTTYVGFDDSWFYKYINSVSPSIKLACDVNIQSNNCFASLSNDPLRWNVISSDFLVEKEEIDLRFSDIPSVFLGSDNGCFFMGPVEKVLLEPGSYKLSLVWPRTFNHSKIPKLSKNLMLIMNKPNSERFAIPLNRSFNSRISHINGTFNRGFLDRRAVTKSRTLSVNYSETYLTMDQWADTYSIFFNIYKTAEVEISIQVMDPDKNDKTENFIICDPKITTISKKIQ